MTTRNVGRSEFEETKEHETRQTNALGDFTLLHFNLPPEPLEPRDGCPETEGC